MPLCQVTRTQTSVGNNVPKSNKKTKKVIKNNVLQRNFFSIILDTKVKLKCTTRAMKTILTNGGIDAYLLNLPNVKLTSKTAVIKNRILSAMEKKGIIDKSPEEVQLSKII